MSLPFVGPGGRGFSLVLMIQFPKYSAFGLVLGNCIIRTKENPRPPGPTNGNDIPKKLLKNNRYGKLSIIHFIPAHTLINRNVSKFAEKVTPPNSANLEA